MIRFTRKAAVIAGTASAAVLVIGGSVAFASTAATTPPPAQVGCVGAGRALVDVYENASGLKSCPKGDFEVSLSSAGATGPAGPQGKTGAAGAQGPAGPAGAGVLPYRTEVDNGTEYATSMSADLADTSASGATYADAGIVTDDGQASSLTASDFAVTSSAAVAENVWIGDGPQASVDGIYPLSDADFCYGLGTDTDGAWSFSMQSKCGSYAGQTLTLAQVASDFGTLEAYTWAGVTSSGDSVSPVSISALGSQSGLKATVGIAADGGVLTPSVSG